MSTLASRFEYTRYCSEAVATYKQLYLETHHGNEISMMSKLKRIRKSPGWLSAIESGIPEMMADYDVPWERVRERAVSAGVSEDTLDKLYGIVCDEAMEQAMLFGWNDMPGWLKPYLPEDMLYDAELMEM